MKKESMERGQKIQQDLWQIQYDLEQLRDRKVNARGIDLMYHGRMMSTDSAEEIRTIAIKSILRNRRTLQREFNKL